VPRIFCWLGAPESGEVPEWLKGADCKSAGLRPTKVRILPSPPAFREGMTRRVATRERFRKKVQGAGIAQLVEHQPSKLRVAGSNPVSRSTEVGFAENHEEARALVAGSRRFGPAHVAQSVEHFLGKEEVTGSNPVMGSRTGGPEGSQTGSGGTWTAATAMRAGRGR
jgi:hypothetical protein